MKAFQAANQQMAQIKNMMNIVKNAGNPQTMISQLAMSNPQVKEAMDYIEKSGGDGQKAFYALAKEKGVNPEDILKQLM
jgi:hypothetical protein